MFHPKMKRNANVDDENVTPSKVVGDLKIGDKRSRIESPGKCNLKGFRPISALFG